MTLHFSSLPLLIRAALCVVLIGLADLAIAEAIAKPTVGGGKGELTIIPKNSQLQLDVKDMPLQSALAMISKKNHFPIHFSALPEAVITTRCNAPNLQQVLECILENKADLIVRYQQKGKQNAAKRLIAEAWVIPSKPDNAPASANPKVNENAVQMDTNANAISQDNLGVIIAKSEDKTDQLLEQTQFNDPAQKAAAIGALLTGGRKDDPLVKDVLERALSDKNPEVRAQAISSLSHREGDAALPAIQQGLQDTSEDVRIMAVEGIRDDIALLQQAVNDNDEVVRSLAEIKLQSLTQRGSVTSPAESSNAFDSVN